jgi:cell wall-associated NlpC family hydrolase
MKTKILTIVFFFQLVLQAFSQDTAGIALVSLNQGHSGEINYYTALSKDVVRARIIEKAQEYIGVDYKWGESSENGFDCSGYVKYVYGHFGYQLPHSSYAQYNLSRRLTEKKAKPGDLVFFVTHGNRISHVGIYIGNRNFIHAPSTGKQVRIESLDTGFFRRTLAGFGSFL